MTDPETEAGREPGTPADDAPAATQDVRDDDYAQAMTRLHRMSAPPSLADEVEATIRRRSGGRFFGRKAFGDRVPFELLAILALAIGLGVIFLLRASQTGSLRYEKKPQAPTIAPGARDVVPQPMDP